MPLNASHLNTLRVRFRGTVYELPVCYSAARCEELLARWPDGVIELAWIFDHESPSSERARAYVVRQTLALAGEDMAEGELEPMPADAVFAPKRSAARLEQLKSHLARVA